MKQEAEEREKRLRERTVEAFPQYLKCLEDAVERGARSGNNSTYIRLHPEGMDIDYLQELLKAEFESRGYRTEIRLGSFYIHW